MIQGTTSNAGKSALAAGLCRLLANRGLRTAPFKPQNMSLNSAVTGDGGEIGRAQFVQSRACRIEPSVHMNPVLLKPNSQIGSQIIIQGKAVGNMNAAQYYAFKPEVMQYVLQSFNNLAEIFEWIVVEGAGSPAEINLRQGDIANMGFAEAVGCPVVIVADIERGGVFAHLYGTYALLSESEKELVLGFVINRFRGDKKLLDSGIKWLEEKTGRPVFGVLPYIEDLNIEAEDSLSSRAAKGSAVMSKESHSLLKIAVLRAPRVSNDTDFDALALNKSVELVFVAADEAVPPCDLIILPGSKNTGDDLEFMRERGWDKAILRHLRYGGKVLGICGGFQMLGDKLHDPQRIESERGTVDGLGLLAMETTLAAEKRLALVQGKLTIGGAPVQGYEIHMGVSVGAVLERPLVVFDAAEAPSCPGDGAAMTCDGALSADNNIAGTYLHGLFDNPQACTAILSWAGAAIGVQGVDMDRVFEDSLERLALEMKKCLDLNLLEQGVDRLLKHEPVSLS